MYGTVARRDPGTVDHAFRVIRQVDLKDVAKFAGGVGTAVAVNIARALGSSNVSGGVQPYQSNLTKYGSKKRSMPSGSRSKSKRSRNDSLTYNRNSTVSKRTSKKRPSKKKKLQTKKFTRKQVKSIRNIILKTNYIKINDQERNVMGQIASAKNKVAWVGFEQLQRTNIDARLTYIRAGVNDAGTIQSNESIELNKTGRHGKKAKFVDTFHYHLKNNTNSSCSIVLYGFRCNHYTTFSPEDEIDELRKSNFTDESVISKEDDFNQYWSLNNTSNGGRKWKIQKKEKIEMAAGEEIHLYRKYTVYVDPGKITELGGASDYFPGCYRNVFRIMGKPSHGSGTEVATLGITETLVDILLYSRKITYVQEDVGVVQATKQLSNTGFGTPTDFVATECDAPSVAPFSDG